LKDREAESKDREAKLHDKLESYMNRTETNRIRQQEEANKWKVLDTAVQVGVPLVFRAVEKAFV